jgi:hypothetical protein
MGFTGISYFIYGVTYIINSNPGSKQACNPNWEICRSLGVGRLQSVRIITLDIPYLPLE